jgi:Ca2+-binding EF-hand superfamily protein
MAAARTSLTLALLLVASSLLVAAQAQAQNASQAGNDTKLEEEVKQRAASAGAEAGRDAGAREGEKAGYKAGAKAAGMDNFSPPVSDQEWEKLAKDNPGATAFFRDYDADEDRHWSQAEWNKGILAAEDRGFIKRGFDRFGEWHKLPKNENGLLNLRDFLAFASRTKANAAPAPEATAGAQSNATRPVPPSQQEKAAEESAQQQQALRQISSKDVESKNNYGKCIRTFTKFDINKNRALSYGEFVNGVREAQKKGEVPDTFNAARAWEHFEHTSNGEVDVYQFVHFCIAVTEDQTDVGGSAKEECWDVFVHFDEDRNQVLSEREFFKGMRRARRQGHVPADLNIRRVWHALPKADGQLEAGPFVDFCVAVSRGEDSQIAARDTLPADLDDLAPPTPEKKGDSKVTEYGGYQGAVSSGAGSGQASSNNVGSHKPRDEIFCATSFHKADDDGDNRLDLDEFRRICETIVDTDSCVKNYTLIFDRFDEDKSKRLTEVEFMKLCKTRGDRSMLDYMGIVDERVRRLQQGTIAGAQAGAQAGLKAGKEAGRDAGAKAAQDVLNGAPKPPSLLQIDQFLAPRL